MEQPLYAIYCLTEKSDADIVGTYITFSISSVVLFCRLSRIFPRPSIDALVLPSESITWLVVDVDGHFRMCVSILILLTIWGNAPESTMDLYIPGTDFTRLTSCVVKQK